MAPPPGESPPVEEPPEEEIAAAAPIAAEAPSGPGEGEEEAFLAEQRLAEPAMAGPAEPEETPADLPPLEDLVARIPAPTRALMDELFRAKFVTVKRVPRSALK